MRCRLLPAVVVASLLCACTTERIAGPGAPAPLVRVPGASVTPPPRAETLAPARLRSPVRPEGPLYIVDGREVPASRLFDSLEIESIEVVKGGAATALYGSRARDGVFVITTTGRRNRATR